MTDLVVAVGLVLVVEGLVWAIFPRYAIEAAVRAARAPEHRLRLGGLAAVALGVAVVWSVRG